MGVRAGGLNEIWGLLGEPHSLGPDMQWKSWNQGEATTLNCLWAPPTGAFPVAPPHQGQTQRAPSLLFPPGAPLLCW